MQKEVWGQEMRQLETACFLMVMATERRFSNWPLRIKMVVRLVLRMLLLCWSDKSKEQITFYRTAFWPTEKFFFQPSNKWVQNWLTVKTISQIDLKISVDLNWQPKHEHIRIRVRIRRSLLSFCIHITKLWVRALSLTIEYKTRNDFKVAE